MWQEPCLVLVQLPPQTSQSNILFPGIKFSWEAHAVATRSTLSELKTVSLPNFASFNVHADSNAGSRWEKWSECSLEQKLQF